MTDTDALLARFEAEYLDRHSISAERRRRMLAQLGGLAARLDGRTLAEITPSDLMAWQGAQLKAGLAPTTVRTRENMLRAFFGWASLAGVISWEQMTELKSVSPVAIPKQIPRPYKPIEIERFREALGRTYPLCPRRGPGSKTLRSYLRQHSPNAWPIVGRHARRLQIEAQVSLALEEGLRFSEIYHLSLAQMDPDNVAVVIPSVKAKAGFERVREVPYTRHSALCVREWLAFRGLLAPGHARPWLSLRRSTATAQQSFREMENALHPIDGDWKWHRFRHTFATERLRAGMPLEKVQLMMGHANLNRTLGYAEIVNADVQAEADRTEDAFARALGLIA